MKRVLGRLLLATLSVSCADVAPVGIVEPCVGRCVAMVTVDLEDVILTPGDTVRLHASAPSADGTDSGVRWSTRDGLRVDSTGLVTAESTGRTVVHARSLADTTTFGAADVLVVHPDAGGQPFLTGFRDARTGTALPRNFGFQGRDSVAVTVSYVLGNHVVTDGAARVLVQVRRPESSIVLRTWSLPLEIRGKAGFIATTLNFGERDVQGQRLLASGSYDLFVLLPLASGEMLGDQTGYRVSF